MLPAGGVQPAVREDHRDAGQIQTVGRGHYRDTGYTGAGRKGVGAALMARVLQEARTRGVASVYAYVRADNKVTLTLTLNLALALSLTTILLPRLLCS